MFFKSSPPKTPSFFPGPASESIIHSPPTNSSETYITLIPLISGSFEAVQGGDYNVNRYQYMYIIYIHNQLFIKFKYVIPLTKDPDPM